MTTIRSKPLTARQQQMLDFIWAFWGSMSCSPSYREIAEGVGISSLSVVAYNLKRLEWHGEVKLQGQRGVIPIGKTCPCCGQIRWANLS
jgi:SOS-response transcriptional repressor LexA